MRVLILGGTNEGRLLGEALAERMDINALMSFAGRTEDPVPQKITTRSGGFGGIDGLKTFLQAEHITHVIDATHPFAARMSGNAQAACTALGLPLLTFTRAPWRPVRGDNWVEVSNHAGALRALGKVPQRIFLTIGRQGLVDFAPAARHFFLIRTIDAPGDLGFLPHHAIIAGRGPFRLESETALMREKKITVLVTKNSGGKATSAKLQAARALGIKVIMIARPPVISGAVTFSLDEALAFAEGDALFHATPPVQPASESPGSPADTGAALSPE